jgi:hypothetical protein
MGIPTDRSRRNLANVVIAGDVVAFVKTSMVSAQSRQHGASDGIQTLRLTADQMKANSSRCARLPFSQAFLRREVDGFYVSSILGREGTKLGIVESSMSLDITKLRRQILGVSRCAAPELKHSHAFGSYPTLS